LTCVFGRCNYLCVMCTKAAWKIRVCVCCAVRYVTFWKDCALQEVRLFSSSADSGLALCCGR